MFMTENGSGSIAQIYITWEVWGPRDWWLQDMGFFVLKVERKVSFQFYWTSFMLVIYIYWHSNSNFRFNKGFTEFELNNLIFNIRD